MSFVYELPPSILTLFPHVVVKGAIVGVNTIDGVVVVVTVVIVLPVPAVLVLSAVQVRLRCYACEPSFVALPVLRIPLARTRKIFAGLGTSCRMHEHRRHGLELVRLAVVLPRAVVVREAVWFLAR